MLQAMRSIARNVKCVACQKDIYNLKFIIYIVKLLINSKLNHFAKLKHMRNL